jgi:hypothetical protein
MEILALLSVTTQQLPCDNLCVVTDNKGKYTQTRQDALLEDCMETSVYI